MTIIHNRVEDFKKQMEQKLTRAYRRAYDQNRLKAKWTARSRRATSDADEEQVKDLFQIQGGY